MRAIKCRGLTKRYGARAVVDGLDLDVELGEVFGFLGPNGAGKTTTARMLLGLVKADGGEAWVLGSKVPCHDRLGEIGSMIEEPAFYPWMTGRENLEVLALEGAAVAEAAVDDALEWAGIAQAAHQNVRSFSQGMRQRLALAAAVLRRPPLVLLDEPANGLDPAGIHDLRGLLRDLAAGGTAVFLSSHLLGEVEQVCDRVAVIDRGRLVASGTLNSLGGAHQRLRVTVAPSDTLAARAALQRWPVTSTDDGELIIDHASGSTVNEALARAGVFASAISPERLTLEEWFLTITQGRHRAPPSR